ncbi:IS5 family transposase [Hoylesella timonensis]|uniref:Transposase, IS4 family n=1 Tax=Hoylesella timonensis CRIS 5C-B1 TaxID=679189 RepID=D1W1V2_9BACT|nr:IS5 family transposase [Hoylesella timonensis]EFA96636.1 transposase, IS4 family [Hoylesella timonensis CRIS 5C-B1]
MFKVIFLQCYYGLGDHQIEYLIIDRTSFREFLNIRTVSDVPDEKTVWACKNKLVKAGVFDTLFDDFRQLLDAKGLSFNEGKIIDATFVEAPGSATPAGKTLLSRTAREMSFGTTTHTRNATRTLMRVGQRNVVRDIMDTKVIRRLTRNQKLIESYHTTASSTLDSNVISQLITDTDQRLYLDAGYEGREDVDKANAMRPVICEKGHRNHPLTKKQKKRNRKKSKRRCRMEHVFGFIEGVMHGSFVRTIGIARAKANFAHTCLVYNIFRYCQINKYQPQLLSCKG